MEMGHLDTHPQPGLRVPFNLEAEQSVVGAVQRDSAYLPTVAECLCWAEFCRG